MLVILVRTGLKSTVMVKNRVIVSLNSLCSSLTSNDGDLDGAVHNSLKENNLNT